MARMGLEIGDGLDGCWVNCKDCDLSGWVEVEEELGLDNGDGQSSKVGIKGSRISSKVAESVIDF